MRAYADSPLCWICARRSRAMRNKKDSCARPSPRPSPNGRGRKRAGGRERPAFASPAAYDIIEAKSALRFFFRMLAELSQHPLAEVIREIRHGGLSGALRVSRQPARIAIYFDSGQLVFAASNLRKHRLREALKQNGITDEQFAEFQNATSDEALARGVIGRGLMTAEQLQAIRTELAQDALRLALLWGDGNWELEPRIRVPSELRVQLASEQLLLECARHLPIAIVKSRLKNAAETFSAVVGDRALTLLPAEEFVLARATAADNQLRFSDLVSDGLPEEQALRSVYGLSLAGALLRSDWPPVLNASEATPSAPKPVIPAVTVEQPRSDEPDVHRFLARMNEARDYYEALDVTQSAETDEIKDAYHALARNFHPDRFHQGASDLRKNVESAFAQIAQAYETLSDPGRRSRYDHKTFGKAGSPQTGANGKPAKGKEGTRKTHAETCFHQGVAALKRNQDDEAIKLLGEAATLEPREARYRAYYGSALTRRTTSRRLAETELRAALSLDPENPTFRFMLAELYQVIGLRRRALTELSRVLAVDPRNEAARNLMATLNKA